MARGHEKFIALANAKSLPLQVPHRAQIFSGRILDLLSRRVVSEVCREPSPEALLLPNNMGVVAVMLQWPHYRALGGPTAKLGGEEEFDFLQGNSSVTLPLQGADRHILLSSNTASMS